LGTLSSIFFKNFLLSFTIGRPQNSYSPKGYNHFKIKELITLHIQNSNLMGAKFIDPVYSHGMIYILDVYNVKEKVEERARKHAERLFETIKSI